MLQSDGWKSTVLCALRGNRRRKRPDSSGHVWVVLIALAAIAGPSAAQVGPSVTPRFPNVTQIPGAILSGLNAPEQGRTAIIAYHNGIVFTVPEIPSSQPNADFQVRTWDIADPTHPIELAQHGVSPMPLSAHGYIKSGDYLVLGGNFPANTPWSFRANGTFSVQRTTFPGLTCIGLRGCAYQPWYLGPVYTLYNTTSGNAVLSRSSNFNPVNGTWGTTTTHSWDHLGQTGVIGHPFILGDLAIFASDQSRTGVATYDIGDPNHPVLLDVLTTGGPGGYHPEVWGGDGKLYLVFQNRDNGNSMRIVDATDPSDLRFVIDRPLSGSQAMYAQFQDEYGFIGDHKIDMRTFESVLFLDGANVRQPNDPNEVGIDTSQYAMPLGNLLITGGVGPDEGMAIWAHQAEPDTRGPSVGYHIPQAGRTHYPLGAPISVLIHETLESMTIINGQTFIVRPLGGNAISGRLVFAYDDILTFTPDQPLLPNTTYEVVFPAGGIKDAAGNGIVGYSFNFSTGSTVGGNVAPVITSLESSSHPVSPAATVTLAVTATDPNGDALEYRFDFGDGSPKTEWSTVSTAEVAFDASGHYRVAAQVRDSSGLIQTETLTVTVVAPSNGVRPTNSSALACNGTNRRIWSVDPDNDTLTAINADTSAKEIEVTVCRDPRNVAAAGSRLWVTCHDDDRVVVVDQDGAQITSLPTGHGSAPIGIAVSPNGATVYVTLDGNGELARYDATSMLRTGTLALGPHPRAIAVSADNARVLVTRFISTQTRGEVWEVNASNFTLTRTIRIPKFGTSDNADTTATGRGVANYLAGITIAPNGQRAWVASNKANTERGTLFGAQLDDDNTVRNVISEIDLGTGTLRRAIDIDNSDSATAIAYSPLGDYLFVTLQGNNQVAVFDALEIDTTVGLAGFVGRLATGLAPQAVCSDATSNRTFVKNLMSRSLTVIETDAFFRRGDITVPSAEVVTSTNESLAGDVLRGKQIFYNAGDPRMSAEGYISCATCHVDGGHDGRVWDFTSRGEGLRNTISLQGRAGVGHGNVHWSANFDEIQDFENDIRTGFGGSGFLSDAQFAATSAPLGAAKAGLSADLDALAAYVTSLDESTVPRSPWRNDDGSMTASAVRGRSLFNNLQCGDCHSGESLTDSSLGAATLHDVGTQRTTSGNRLGGPLTGIDTPTLLGLWDSAPYLHDGSAATLDEAFQLAGGTVIQAETGAVSGDARVINQFVDINNDDTVHNRAYVGMPRNNARLTLSNVNGGPGGVGIIEIRYSANFNPQVVDVAVNGTHHNVNLPLVGNDPTWRTTYWGRARVENVLLAAGNANTIELTATGAFPNFSIDDVMVTTPNELTAAQPHRQVIALASGDRADLNAYLLELDGVPEGGPVPTPTSTLAPSATSPPTATSTSTATASVTDTPLPTATETSVPSTATASPTMTIEATSTATSTPTPLPSETSTASPSPTEAPTTTATPTVTSSPAITSAPVACDSGIVAEHARLRARYRPFGVKFSGEAVLSKPWNVDPYTNGVRVILDGLIDVGVPGGAMADGSGWYVNTAGNKWIYRDGLGRHGGITRMTIQDRSFKADGMVRWKVQIGGTPIDLPDPVAATVTMVLGDAVECAVSRWNPPGALRPRCEGDARTLSCR